MAELLVLIQPTAEQFVETATDSGMFLLPLPFSGKSASSSSFA